MFGRLMRVRRSLAVVAGAIAVTAALTVGGAAFAIGELDQSNTAAAAGAGSFNQEYQRAQTFTAGKSGLLDAVAFPTDVAGEPGDLVVQIQGLTDGKPNGTVLASQTVPKASVPTDESELTVTFDIPASVEAGQGYAIVFTSTAGGIDCMFEPCDTTGGAYFVFGSTGNDDYPPGVSASGKARQRPGNAAPATSSSRPLSRLPTRSRSRSRTSPCPGRP
jgi:hypothetical protein